MIAKTGDQLEWGAGMQGGEFDTISELLLGSKAPLPHCGAANAVEPATTVSSAPTPPGNQTKKRETERALREHHFATPALRMESVLLDRDDDLSISLNA
ncbi:uncharacterized protein BP5553_10398 [Venustampulla echinocandica]|uniref:Uncharacterized protein n=1 Tax=Venustampulla echinocandica TaxID=2656787 RepID=A0A370T970_9HELO|nr:uncharacterized protein BP5553_10398 [Venustampulla echinocandica]RDL30120.1 hypothetical protein BP5553_10398 [Venustampulla echinocandica]